MFLIPPSPRLRRFHVHRFNLLSIGLLCLKSRILTSFILKTEISLLKKGWSQGVMRRLWFYELFDAVLFYGFCPLVKLLLRFSWRGKGGLFLNVALFVGPQYSEQNQSEAKNEKTFMWWVTMMNLALKWSYFCTYLQCWSENVLLWMWVGGDQNMYHVFYETFK